MALPNVRGLFDNRISAATTVRLKGLGPGSITGPPLVFPGSFDYDGDAGPGLEATRMLWSCFFDPHHSSGDFLPGRMENVPRTTVIETSIGLGE